MLTAIRQWVIRTMMKAKGETGIVQTMPKKEIVEINTQITAQRLMQNGVNPESLKNADQVENAIIAIENRKNVQTGITSTKSADVFDLKGKKIKDTDNIMGGEELPPPGSRGGPDDIAAPVQSAEETMKNMIEAENKKGIANIQKRILEEDREIENLYGSAGFGKDQKIDAEFLAEYLAENAGKVYDDLPTKERLNFYNRAFNALTRYKRTKGTSVIDEPKKLDPRTKEKMDDIKDIEDPEDMAQGGRAGFSKGSAFKTILNFLNENNPVQAYQKYLKSVKTRAQENPKALVPELAAIASGGIFVNRRMQDILKNMKEKDMENNLENFKEELNKDPFYQKYPDIKDKVLENYTEKMFGEKRADGGRIGLKDGMDRRTFMKIMAGLTALPVLGKFFKGAKVASKAAPIIKTPNAPGKPEWFDALVTKVVNEGTDVTKGFATKERQLVHTKQINDFAEVTVYRDLDTNTTIVNYGSKLRKDPTKPYERGNIQRAVNDPDQIDLVVKGAEDVEPTIIENERGFVRRRGTKTNAEFEAYESEPRVVNYDGDMEFDGTNVVNNVDDLNEDVSVLKEYATGKKLSAKEAAKAKKKREDYQKFLEDPVEQANYLENKYGPARDTDDFASGGIARMLGE